VSEFSNNRFDNKNVTPAILYEKPTTGGGNKTQDTEKETTGAAWAESNTARSKKNKIIAAVAAATLALGAGAAGWKAITSGEEAPQTPPTSEINNPPEAVIENQTEALQDRINGRPEMSSTEYMELFDHIKIPYVEGQSPEEVVQASFVVRKQLTELMFSEVADMTTDERFQWALENDTASREDTAFGIMEQLDLDYYTPGYANTLYGPDAVRSEFAENTLNLFITTSKGIVSYAIQTNTKLDPQEIFITNAGIFSHSETDIYARPIGYDPYVEGSKENLNVESSIHLKAVKVSDSETNWYLVNNASDTNG
jgi:hypothetical protein